jgi:hypothetical protein
MRPAWEISSSHSRLLVDSSCGALPGQKPRTTMHPLLEPRPRQRRYSTRFQARLDSDTHAKLEALANTFHRKRAAVLYYVIQRGLAHTQAWTIDPSIPDRPHLVPILVEPDLLQQVQEAADVHGVSVAVFLRHAMRQVTIDDFPENWCAGATTMRSPEASYFRLTFGLWLDTVPPRRLRHAPDLPPISG